MTKWISKALVVLVVAGAVYSSHAVTSDDRYNTIVERNVFRLTSPPPPPAAPETNEALDRNIELSGIQIVNGRKKAFFVVKAKNAKEGPQYVSLGEGERKESLEVQTILDNSGEVKILNAGNPMVLSFTNNGVKVAPGSAPAPKPVATAAVLPHSTVSSVNPFGSRSQANNYGNHSVTVAGGTSSTPSPGSNPGISGIVNNGGLRSIPSRTVRLPTTSQPANSQPSVDPVTQRALMEIQAEHARQTGQTLPPLPPLPGQ
jgi:hypothetical protein